MSWIDRLMCMHRASYFILKENNARMQKKNELLAYELWDIWPSFCYSLLSSRNEIAEKLETENMEFSFRGRIGNEHAPPTTKFWSNLSFVIIQITFRFRLSIALSSLLVLLPMITDIIRFKIEWTTWNAVNNIERIK